MTENHLSQMDADTLAEAIIRRLGQDWPGRRVPEEMPLPELASAIASAVLQLVPQPRTPFSEAEILASAIASQLTAPGTMRASQVVDAILAEVGQPDGSHAVPMTISLSGLQGQRVAEEVGRLLDEAARSESPGHDAVQVLARSIAKRLSTPVFAASSAEFWEFTTQVGSAVASYLREHADSLPGEDVGVGETAEDEPQEGETP